MKRALVLGAAACVWSDATEAFKLVTAFDRIYCVKAIGVEWEGPFDVWATLHPEMMDDYEAKRAAKGYPSGYEIVAPPAAEVGEHGKKGHIARRVSYRWPGMNSSASSGIYGAKVAMDDGCTHVVLAGIPMSTEGGHFQPETTNARGLVRGTTWQQRDSFVTGLLDSVPFMQGHVKSMSGYTAELLGTPTPEWLVGETGRVAIPAAQAAGADLC